MSGQSEHKLFIFGLGYVGTRLANRCINDGWSQVGGSVRASDVTTTGRGQRSSSNDEYSQRLHENVEVYYLPPPDMGRIGLEYGRKKLKDVLEKYDSFLFTAPVDRKKGHDPFLSDPVIGPVLEELAMEGKVYWAGYLSTTSVYGDHGGDWVDEDTPAMPTLKRGQKRAEVEHYFRMSGLPAHIFRLPGIYGPGRGTISRVRKGDAKCIVKENQIFSRIHVDDIVGVLLASIANPNPGRIYNVTDDEPCPNHEVIEYVCSILGLKPPKRENFEDVKASMSAMSLSFFSESKRVKNQRIKNELGYKLLYPNYKIGMKAQLEEELANGWTVLDVSTAVNSPSPVPFERKEGSEATNANDEGGYGWMNSPRAGRVSSKDKNVAGGDENNSSSNNGKQPKQTYSPNWWEWLVNVIFRPMFNYVKRTFCDWTRFVFQQFNFTMGKKSKIECIIVDNGSLRPEPYEQLRVHAARLETELGGVANVTAVSARYSDRIDPTLLGGIRALTLERYLEKMGDSKSSTVIALPFFLGPSSTATSFIPKQLKNRFSNVIIGQHLVSIQDGIVADIMTDLIEQVASEKQLRAPFPVVLVDHGSPSKRVNLIRRSLAAQLRKRLGDRATCVVDCSMERRPGPEYDFNDPLLENVFKMGGLDQGDVVVAMAFLAPGRHAGAGGDISEILDTAIEENAKEGKALRIHQTELIGDPSRAGEKIVQLLKLRFHQASLL